MLAKSNLFLVGPMGSGKSAVGKQLSRLLRRPFYDSDLEIERRTGVDIPYIFEKEGEAGFRQRENETLEILTCMERIVMATGGGAILLPENRRILAERGYVLWLQATLEQQLERLAQDRQRPLLAGVDRAERLTAMALQRTPLYEDAADLAIPGAHETVHAASERSILLIDRCWQRQHAA